MLFQLPSSPSFLSMASLSSLVSSSENLSFLLQLPDVYLRLLRRVPLLPLLPLQVKLPEGPGAATYTDMEPVLKLPHAIQYGPVLDQKPWAFQPLRVHFDTSVPFLEVQGLSFSRDGNVGIQEGGRRATVLPDDADTVLLAGASSGEGDPRVCLGPHPGRGDLPSGACQAPPASLPEFLRCAPCFLPSRSSSLTKQECVALTVAPFCCSQRHGGAEFVGEWKGKLQDGPNSLHPGIEVSGKGGKGGCCYRNDAAYCREHRNDSGMDPPLKKALMIDRCGPPPFSVSLRRRRANQAVMAKLPGDATGVYFRDDYGNISSSRLYSRNGKVEVILVPRFPLLGGWKTSFVLGYDLPMESHVERVSPAASWWSSLVSGDRLRLTALLGCPIEQAVVEDLQVKVSAIALGDTPR